MAIDRAINSFMLGCWFAGLVAIVGGYPQWAWIPMAGCAFAAGRISTKKKPLNQQLRQEGK